MTIASEADRRAARFLLNYLREHDDTFPGTGSADHQRILNIVERFGARSDDDRREASKLLVDVAKVAITLTSGAIAVDGAFLKGLHNCQPSFWLFLASIAAFIVSTYLSLTGITRTIERAGGKGALAWEYQQEARALALSSLFGFVGIILFVAGAVFY